MTLSFHAEHPPPNQPSSASSTRLVPHTCSKNKDKKILAGLLILIAIKRATMLLSVQNHKKKNCYFR